MKLYTKTGDNGSSSLYNGSRVSKTSEYFSVLGDLDELNSHIGMSKSYWKASPDGDYLPDWDNVGSILTDIQCNIMDISSFIAYS